MNGEQQRVRSQHAKRLGILMLPVGLLSACATFHSKPLPTGPDWASQAALTVPVRQLAVPGLKPHPFDPAQGLDRTDVVILAVLNNPQLRAARLQAGVAAAQLIQAGVIPNPQVSASFLTPLGGGPPPLYNAYNLGLMQSVTALITRGAAKARAKSHKKQVNLDILWQEWQVAEQARQLFIQANAQDKLQKVLKTQQKLSRQNYARDEKALKQGNAALSATSAALVTLVNANTQLRQLERTRNKTWHSLDALLGLAPGTQPKLLASPQPPQFTHAHFKQAIEHMPQRRPDLLALQAGYQSQQASVRKAILQQFPQISVGPTGGSDTSGVRTIGFGVNLSLPFFNHNEGNIAIQRATRAALWQQYQARLDQAVNQAHQMWKAVQIMRRQRHELDQRLPVLEQTTDAAQRAFARGDMSAGAYINLRSSLLSKQVEAIKLRSSLAQAEVGLQTLLGMMSDRVNSSQ